MLTQEDALRAYAAMLNASDVSKLAPLLADDFHYASQTVLVEIESKADFVEYITAKLKTIQESGDRVWAEMGWLDHRFSCPCVVVAQGDRDTLVATVLAEIQSGKV